MLKHEEDSVEEKRYDAQAVQKMVAVATRLEQHQYDTMTAEQVEQIGAEVGLDPSLMRKALAQLEAQEASRKSLKKLFTRSSARTTSTTGVLRTKQELSAWTAAFALPFVHAILAYFLLLKSPHAIPATHAANIVLLVLSPIALSWLPGWLTGRKRAGLLGGLWYAVCIFVVMSLLHPTFVTNSFEGKRVIVSTFP